MADGGVGFGINYMGRGRVYMHMNEKLNVVILMKTVDL